MKWISVKDRLPEIPDGLSGIHVIVALHYRVFADEMRYEIQEGIYDGGRGFKIYSPLNADESRIELRPISIGGGPIQQEYYSAITHWMPLPDAPE